MNEHSNRILRLAQKCKLTEYRIRKLKRPRMEKYCRINNIYLKEKQFIYNGDDDDDDNDDDSVNELSMNDDV